MAAVSNKKPSPKPVSGRKSSSIRRPAPKPRTGQPSATPKSRPVAPSKTTDQPVKTGTASVKEAKVQNLPNLAWANETPKSAQQTEDSKTPPRPTRPQVNGNHPGDAQRQLKAYDEKLKAWEAKYGEQAGQQQGTGGAQPAPPTPSPTEEQGTPGIPPRPTRPQVNGNHPGDAQRQLRAYDEKLKAWEAKYGSQ
jgi:hypothetical protein